MPEWLTGMGVALIEPVPAERRGERARRGAWSPRGVVDRLLAAITEDRLRAAARAVTGIPSPTGREAPLARFLADRLAAAGFAATAQHIDESQANAVGRLRGAVAART